MMIQALAIMAVVILPAVVGVVLIELQYRRFVAKADAYEASENRALDAMWLAEKAAYEKTMATWRKQTAELNH